MISGRKGAPSKEGARQRPLDRSPRQQVFSYYVSNRVNPDESRARYAEPASNDKRRFMHVRYLPTFVAAMILVACALYSLQLSANPRITVASSRSGQSLERPHDVYTQAVSTILHSSWKHKSKLTFNSADVARQLQVQFPEISTVIITVPIMGQRPVVMIAVASPVFTLATTSGEYYVSDRGVVLLHTRDAMRPVPDMPVVTDQSNIPVEAGKAVLPQQSITYVRDILRQFRETKTDIESVILPPEPNEILVRLPNVPYVVRMNTLLDARTSVGTLLATRNRLQQEGKTPGEYIDVRVEERVYYR